MDWERFRPLFLTFATVIGISILLAVILIILAFYKIRSIRVRPDAGFAETLAATPLIVVLALDLLDLSLDILSAPIAWWVLDRLGLKGLRGVSVIQALIPMTQPVPVMTLCWLAVRRFGPRVFRRWDQDRGAIDSGKAEQSNHEQCKSKPTKGPHS